MAAKRKNSDIIAATMKIAQPHNETKLEKFLFRGDKRKMVTGEFIAYRNVGRDANVVKLVSKIQEETGREDGMFTIFYATRRVYTADLYFNWHPQTPYYYRALEDYWRMVQDGESDAECYMFYIDNIHNEVGKEWNAALEAAQYIWKPPEEGWDDETDEEGNPTDVDPNS